MAKRDPFKEAAGFVAAFDQIRNRGYFEDFEVHLFGTHMEGTVYACSIKAVGCIPSAKRYEAAGCGVLVEPKDIIARCKDLARRLPIQHVKSKVETEDWAEHNDDTGKVTKQKGTRTTLSLFVQFKT